MTQCQCFTIARHRIPFTANAGGLNPAMAVPTQQWNAPGAAQALEQAPLDLHTHATAFHAGLDIPLASQQSALGSLQTGMCLYKYLISKV